MTISRKHVIAALWALSGLFIVSAASALELDSANSRVSLVSTKIVGDGKASVAEVFSFPTLSGQVGDDGAATVAIDLSSVSTGVDIRNERMRDFFFDVGNYPEARITAAVGKEFLNEGTQKTDLDVTVAMHGSEANYTVPVVITATNNNITVVAVEPVLVNATQFELDSGLGKLTELAGLFHIPTTVPVSFSLSFNR